MSDLGSSIKSLAKCFPRLPVICILIWCSFPECSRGAPPALRRMLMREAASKMEGAAKGTKKLPDDSAVRKLGGGDFRLPTIDPQKSDIGYDSQFKELDSSLERLSGPTNPAKFQRQLESRLLETGKSTPDETMVTSLGDAVKETQSLVQTVASSKRILRDLIRSDDGISQFAELKTAIGIENVPEHQLLAVPEVIRRTEIEESLLSGLPGHEEYLNKTRELKILFNSSSHGISLYTKNRVIQLAAQAFESVSRQNPCCPDGSLTDSEETIRSNEHMNKVLSWKLNKIEQLRVAVKAAESIHRILSQRLEEERLANTDLRESLSELEKMQASSVFGDSTSGVSERIAWVSALDESKLLIRKIEALSQRLFKENFQYSPDFDKIAGETISSLNGRRLSDLHVDIAVHLVRSGYAKRAQEWLAHERDYKEGLERVRAALIETPQRLGFTPMKQAHFGATNVRSFFEHEFNELEKAVAQLETYLIVESVAVYGHASQRLECLSRKFNPAGGSPGE